jgi:hypothetical protein
MMFFTRLPPEDARRFDGKNKSAARNNKKLVTLIH